MTEWLGHLIANWPFWAIVAFCVVFLAMGTLYYFWISGGEDPLTNALFRRKK